MYFHRTPDFTENGTIPDDFVENRTLHVNNKGQKPVDPERNLTDSYKVPAEASCVTLLFPGDYPESIEVASKVMNPKTDITLDYLMIYRDVQLAMIASTVNNEYANLVNLTTGEMVGDRTGRLHIGYNQTLYIGTGQLSTDVSLYHGSTTTLQGELRAAGITVTVEGIVDRVENITIVDGGKILCYIIVFC